MPDRVLYTPQPGPYMETKRVFEYIALIRLKVETSYIGFNPLADSNLIQTSVMNKPTCLKRDWPPAANSERALPIAAISKLKEYLDWCELEACERAGVGIQHSNDVWEGLRSHF